MSQVLSKPMPNQSLEAYVSGNMRQIIITSPLFVKRPFQPTMGDLPLPIAQSSFPNQQMPEAVKVKADKQNILQEEEIEVFLSYKSKTKSTQIQTDYRDQEAQTDPFTPEHIIRQGEIPEIYSLKQLTYGKGLPASIQQLDMIQMKRQKMWFQHALPPISDQASFLLRRALMQEQQLREWGKKQSQIKKLHNERLYLVQTGLIERQKDVQQKNNNRNEEIKISKTQNKNRLIAKVQRRKIKVLRKLLKSRKNKDQQGKKRDIIDQYANFASKVYAGITRQGLSLDKIASKYQVQPSALTNYRGIQQLSQKIKTKEVETKIDMQKNKDSIYKAYTRLQNSHKRCLEQAQRQLIKKNQPIKQASQDLQQQFKNIKNIVARPPTPTYQIDQNMNIKQQKTQDIKVFKNQSIVFRYYDKRKSSIIFLQRVIRGRTQQNIMYEGKEKRLALIEQLLTVAKTQALSQEEAEERLMREHQEKLKNALLQGIQGELISKTLDGLNKQLLKLKQKRRISQLRDVAQRDRQLRQIQQAGRRQAQQVIRDREQYLYNQMMKMNQGTVDTYLDFLMKSTVDKGKIQQLASGRQAQIMANLRKTQMNSHLETFQRKYNNNQTLIRNLVQSFLLPNIQRSKLIKKIQLEQRRFQAAAKKSLHITMTKTDTKLQEASKLKNS